MFENQLSFADDTPLVADSEDKLCRLASGRVCEIRKLRVNVGKSKVMRCSRYGDGGRKHVILNDAPACMAGASVTWRPRLRFFCWCI